MTEKKSLIDNELISLLKKNNIKFQRSDIHCLGCSYSIEKNTKECKNCINGSKYENFYDESSLKTLFGKEAEKGRLIQNQK